MFIITSRAKSGFDDSPYAASTITWVSQASFEPPLIMIGLRNDSWVHEAVKQSQRFALNVVGKRQKVMAGKFFKHIKVHGNKINDYEFETDVTGAPLFKAMPAYVECLVEKRLECGDHSVIVGRIINAKVRFSEDALLLKDTGWSYGG